ncbi:MAG: hypothetical protein DRO18_03370 [Thermoprotei archaeon]|nr:MAG: hypothetical protein DRO18_03370 [Thermoprotei archaeon]
MPVRIKKKERVQGSVTPTSLNGETDLINLGDQDDDYIIEGQIDLSNMQDGDKVIIRVYIAVDGVNQRKSDELDFTDAQDIPVVRVVAHTIPYNGKFRVTIMQTAGTLRTFPYSFIYQIMETI